MPQDVGRNGVADDDDEDDDSVVMLTPRSSGGGGPTSRPILAAGGCGETLMMVSPLANKKQRCMQTSLSPPPLRPRRLWFTTEADNDSRMMLVEDLAGTMLPHGMNLCSRSEDDDDDDDTDSPSPSRSFYLSLPQLSSSLRRAPDHSASSSSLLTLPSLSPNNSPSRFRLSQRKTPLSAKPFAFGEGGLEVASHGNAPPLFLSAESSTFGSTSLRRRFVSYDDSCGSSITDDLNLLAPAEDRNEEGSDDDEEEEELITLHRMDLSMSSP
jgi:hypothetical protein